MNLQQGTPFYALAEYVSDLEQTRDAQLLVINAHAKTIREYEAKLNAVPNTKVLEVIAAAYMLKHLKIPYVFGGDWVDSNPDKHRAFDCSSFTQAAFASQGIALPRTSVAQSKVGKMIESIERIMPGDTLHFDTNKNGVINHVGIALANGDMIHTAKPGEGIVVNNWQTRYGSSSLKAIRRHI